MHVAPPIDCFREAGTQQGTPLPCFLVLFCVQSDRLTMELIRTRCCFFLSGGRVDAHTEWCIYTDYREDCGCCSCCCCGLYFSQYASSTSTVVCSLYFSCVNTNLHFVLSKYVSVTNYIRWRNNHRRRNNSTTAPCGDNVAEILPFERECDRGFWYLPAIEHEELSKLSKFPNIY